MTTKRMALLVSVLLGVASSGLAAVDTDAERFLGHRFTRDISGRMRAAGIGFQVAAEPGGFRLLKPLCPVSGRHKNIAYTDKMAWALGGADIGGIADLGLVRPVEGQGPMEFEGDWTHAAAGFKSGSDSFRLTVSRLSPAVLIETSGAGLEMFGGARPPYLAAAGGEIVMAVSAKSTPTDAVLSAERLDFDEGWFLAWYGAASAFPCVTDFKPPGAKTEADCRLDIPILVVVPPALKAIRLSDSNGLVLDFAGKASEILVMPLWGETPLLVKAGADAKPEGRDRVYPWETNAPPTSEWAGTLPEDVLARCRYWAARLSEFPVSLREESVYDGAADELRVKVSCKFRSIRPGGVRFAPVSPALALARWGGMPVVFLPEPKETKYLTPWGPFLGVENADGYEYAIKGLGRFAAKRGGPVQGDGVPAELRARLDEEADKIIAAGAMAPWFFFESTVGLIHPRPCAKHPYRLTYGNPAEDLYYLTELLDVSDPGRREKLSAMLREWSEGYLGMLMDVLEEPDSSDKGYPACLLHTPPDQGARREYYAVDHLLPVLRTFPFENRWGGPERNFHIANRLLPVESLYYIAACYGALGETPPVLPVRVIEPYWRRHDWASGNVFRWDSFVPHPDKDYKDWEYGWSGAADANRLFAGTVGMLRLAQAAGDEAVAQRAWYYLAKAAVARLAMEKLKYYLYSVNLLAPPRDQDRFKHVGGPLAIHTFTRASPGDDPLAAIIWDEDGPCMHETGAHLWGLSRLTPYLGMTPELGLLLREFAAPEVRAYCAKTEESVPEWYTVMAGNQWVSEQGVMYPEDSYQLFLARAWIAGDPPERLFKYADLPWLERGDWYYIHKLAETARAYNADE